MNTFLLTVLLSQLGSDDFKTRELAHKKLEQLFPVAVPYLYQAQSCRDPEIAARTSKLYKQWAWQMADTIRPTHWPYLPWIDSLPYTYPERYPTINGYLGAVGHCPGTQSGQSDAPSWTKYRAATKLFVYKMLVDGKQVNEVRAVLDTMVDYEKGWIKKNQHSYQFPKEMLAACQ